jgi:hypothetical protein
MKSPSMNISVDMFRDTIPNGRNRFSCALSDWEFLQGLAKRFGWDPQGTTYLAPPKAKIELAAKHDYQPGDALDSKQIEAGDAVAWASALDQAKRSADIEALLLDRSWTGTRDHASTLASGLGLLNEFVQYAYGGAFTFALSQTASIEDEKDAGGASKLE